jgi:phosphoribosyl 1,2-cyclic phosphodiesterase
MKKGSETTDNRGPNMKHIMNDIQSTICNDLMSWDELADKVLELETEISNIKDAAKEVIRISDRKHDAWDKLKKLIKKEN